mmetsp:Transcript_7596/g.14358  ORF Transcript_7596/g.14358 Transcript_7596/m.14358 type:complete len:155 (+) Transcript_7596:393-857(+)
MVRGMLETSGLPLLHAIRAIASTTLNVNILTRSSDTLAVCAQVCSKVGMVDLEASCNQLVQAIDGVQALQVLKAEILAVSQLLKTRRYRMRQYRNCLVGSKLVDWLLETGRVRTRQEGEQKGQGLVDGCGLVCSVHGSEHDGFKDGKLLYHFHT